jgi:hypothetical protein
LPKRASRFNKGSKPIEKKTKNNKKEPNVTKKILNLLKIERSTLNIDVLLLLLL